MVNDIVFVAIAVTSGDRGCSYEQEIITILCRTSFCVGL